MKLLRLAVVLVVLIGLGWVGLTVATGGSLPLVGALLDGQVVEPAAEARAGARKPADSADVDTGELLLVRDGEVLDVGVLAAQHDVAAGVAGDGDDGAVGARGAAKADADAPAANADDPTATAATADDHAAELRASTKGADPSPAVEPPPRPVPVGVVGVLTRIEELGRSTGIACEAIDVPVVAHGAYALSGRGDVSALTAFFAALEQDPTFAGLSALHVWSEDAVLGFQVDVALAAGGR